MSNFDQGIDKWDPKRVAVWVTRAIGYVLYVYILIVELILLLGFLLKLFGANPSSGFTDWAYGNLERVMEPFRGIFGDIEIGQTGNDVPAVIDTSVLFAMVIYGIVALALHWLIHWLSHRIDKMDRDARAAAQREEYERATQELEARRAAAGLPPTNPTPVSHTPVTPVSQAPNPDPEADYPASQVPTSQAPTVPSAPESAPTRTPTPPPPPPPR
jgi:hypothetical protein